MADRFIIEVLDDALQQRLARSIALLEQPRELLDAVGAKLEENANLRFSTKVDPNGLPWAPLAASTLARKKGEGSLLKLSGYMQEGLCP